MRITDWLEFTDAAFELFVGMMLVSTTAVAFGGLIAPAFRRRASIRHAAWLCSLAVVLLSPGLAWLGRKAALPPVAWPRAVAKADPAASTAGFTPNPVAARLDARREFIGPPRHTDVAAYAEGLAFYAPDPHELEQAAFNRATATPAPVLAEMNPVRNRIARGAVVLLWLLGSLGLLARLAWAFRGIVRLRRSARPFDGQAVRASVAAALGVGVERLPTIAVSDRASQPSAFGVIQPMVLIPEGLTEALPADALRDVLVHECAHILRRDAVVGLLQRFAAVLCWPNPLVHAMNRALESAREELCDNHVLRAADPVDYAASLLAVAERRPLASDLDALLGLPILARRGSLESRIAALIDPSRHVETSMRRGVVAALAVLFLAAGAAVAAVRFDDAVQAPPVLSSKPLDPSKTRIEGVVVDESGKPAGGVLVRVWAYWGEPPETRTGVDGRFVLDVDPSPRISLLASNADGSLQAVDREAGLYLYSIDRLVNASLVLKTARPTVVRVTDHQGAPVADAAVEIDNDFAPWWQGRTDANGEARFRIPADVRARTVCAFKSGMGFDSLEDEEFWPGLEAEYLSEIDAWPGIESKRLPEVVKLVLDGATTVRIQALDSANKPMPGVPVVPHNFWKLGRRSQAYLFDSRLARVTTDYEGVAVFDFVPRDLMRPGILDFSVPSKTLCIADSSSFDPLKPKAKLQLRVARTVPVSGRVFMADGRPAPGIMILAEGRDLTDRAERYGYHSTRTGSDGSYHLDLYPDQLYLIGVQDDQWAARSRGGVLPREGSTIQGVDFHLISGTLIKGRVTSATDHTPVAGSVVKLFEHGNGMKHPSILSGDSPFPRHEPTETLIRRTRTDRDGRYVFRVGPGRFVPPDKDPSFTAFIKIDEYTEFAPDPRIKLRREPDVDYDFEVQSSERRPFVVTVRGPGGDGAPEPHAYIAASESNPEGGMLVSPFEARADARGRLQARRTYSLKHLYARSADGSLGGFGTVGPDDEETTIGLDEATTIRGRMVSEDGAPAPHARLDCYLVGPVVVEGRPMRDESRNPSDRDCVQIVIFSDPQGRYTLSGLPVGTRVYLDQILGRPNDRSRSIELEVKDLSPIAAPDVVAKSTSE